MGERRTPAAAAAFGLMVSFVGTFSWLGKRQILDPRSGHRSRDIASLSLSLSLPPIRTAILSSAAEAGIRDIPSAEINLTILDSFIACHWLQALYPDATWKMTAIAQNRKRRALGERNAATPPVIQMKLGPDEMSCYRFKMDSQTSSHPRSSFARWRPEALISS